MGDADRIMQRCGVAPIRFASVEELRENEKMGDSEGVTPRDTQPRRQPEVMHGASAVGWAFGLGRCHPRAGTSKLAM